MFVWRLPVLLGSVTGPMIGLSVTDTAVSAVTFVPKCPLSPKPPDEVPAELT
jgi:hypothetical protein